MFDSESGVDAAAVLRAAAMTHRDLVVRECELLVVAAAWADCHPGEVDAGAAGSGPRGGVVARRLGGEGTPLVAWGCVAELGAVLETSTGAAEGLVGDALELRHRLPRLWRLVVGGGVRAWKARRVAQATRGLSVSAAGLVDAAVVGAITGMAWARFERLVEAAVLAADPVGAEAQARMYEAERFVRAGRSVAGLTTVVARAQAGDVAWFMAMVNRIAEVLAAGGDGDAVEVRRSKAVGVLANPARALQLLTDHADDHAELSPQAVPEPVDHDVAVDVVDAADRGCRSVALGRPWVDPAKLMPTVVLHVHVAQEAVTSGAGVARVEGIGPVTLGQVRRFLGAGGVRVRVSPVIDVAGMAAVDRYEVSGRMRSAVLARSPGDVFPWGVCTSRSMDLDHTIAYLSPDEGGPPGQTAVGNLGPLSRSHHRLKTFGGWSVRQPEPGSFVWRSPHGWCYVVNASGTHGLGNGVLATTVWSAVVAARSRYTPAA